MTHHAKRFLFIIPFVSLLFASERGLKGEEPSAFHLQKEAAKEAAILPDTFHQAKNIILFLGDGMGVSTVTAARILDGQNRGGMGEEHNLFFDGFEYTALSKTYALNQQTSDSASTMTAIMTGHKTKAYTINYDEKVIIDDYRSVVEFGGESKPLETLVDRFEREGKATGIVTTTRLTHATPACCYAHSANRFWEDYHYGTSESDLRYKEGLEKGLKDIARQLVEFPIGNGIDVALGGGRRGFLPAKPDNRTAKEGTWGRRLDGRNLIEAWLEGESTAYVDSRDALLKVDTTKPKRLLGLFANSDLEYETDIDPDKPRTQPRLSEMATVALDLLKHNDKGFFLMVEGGRIDHAHHMANAQRALIETIEFDRAIQAVYESLTEQEREETLIVVTADHSHTLTIAGYPTRGNPILGKVKGNDSGGHALTHPNLDELKLPYTTLSYANGPGNTALTIDTETHTPHAGGLNLDHGKRLDAGKSRYINTPVSPRPDLHDIDTEAADYLQEGLVPMKSETHGGEDVVIYARGPGSHLFRGTREQNFIFHAILQAMGNP